MRSGNGLANMPAFYRRRLSGCIVNNRTRRRSRTWPDARRNIGVSDRSALGRITYYIQRGWRVFHARVGVFLTPPVSPCVTVESGPTKNG